MTRKITITAGDKEYAGQIGTIKSTRLGYEDHGIFTAELNVEWPSGGVSVGGFALDKSRGDKDGREGTAFGLDQIIWIMHTVGVDRWEQLVGRQVIVLFDGESVYGSRAVGIASITDMYAVLVFERHAENWRKKEEQS